MTSYLKELLEVNPTIPAVSARQPVDHLTFAQDELGILGQACSWRAGVPYTT